MLAQGFDFGGLVGALANTAGALAPGEVGDKISGIGG